MKCVLCGTENNDGLEKCSKCGSKLSNNPVSDKLSFLRNETTTETVETPNVAETTETVQNIVEDKPVVSNDTTEAVEKIDETSSEEKVIEVAESVEIVEEVVQAEADEKSEIEPEIKEVIEVTEDNEVIIKNVEESKAEKAANYAKKSFKEFKGKNPSIFTKKNMAIGVAGLVLVVILIPIFINVMFSEEPNQTSVAYESQKTLFVHNSYENEVTELFALDDNYEYGLMKSTMGQYYYPTNTSIIEGNTKFSINKFVEGGTETKVNEAYFDYLVSKDGRYIVYFRNVQNLYGDDVAEMYYVDTKEGTEEILIDTNVIISSVKVSDDSKDLIYIKADTFGLNRYDFGKSKPKEIDDSVDEIIYVSDDLSKILYVKPQKQINDMYMYTLYSAFDNNTNKIATNVIKESVHYGAEGVMYLKAPDKYPDFSVFDKATKGLSKKEIKALKVEFDNFCTENFFSLYQADLKGKGETEIAENVYALNFVSSNGNAAIITKFKDKATIDQANITKISDLISPKNLESYVLDVNRTLIKLNRVADTTLLSVDENYGFDTESNDIYYLDGDSIIKLTYGTIYESKVLDTGVKDLWYTNSSLAYLKTDNTLYQVFKENEPTLVDENILTDSVVASENCLYYEQKQKNGDIRLYVKVGDDKPKKISDKLVSTEITVFDNYAYFVDEKDGLSFFNGKKVKALDKNASEVYILTNGLQGE